MANQQRIFLGHASENKPRVRELNHDLKSRGFSPWLDATDLMPGQNWRIVIPNAIKSASIFLACRSKRSVVKQSYVQRELRYALSAYADRPPGPTQFGAWGVNFWQGMGLGFLGCGD